MVEQIMEYRDIISGVIANALTSLAGYIIRDAEGRLQAKEATRKKLSDNRNLNTMLQKATASVAKTLIHEDNKVLDKLKIFLISPEVHSIVRQIFANRLNLGGKRDYSSFIRDEFSILLSMHIGMAHDDISDMSTDLFDLIINGCEFSLMESIEKGILSAHEAKSIYRHNFVISELNIIKRNIEHLQSGFKPNITDILLFEIKYREQLAFRHRYITPPHFDKQLKIPIDQLYVSPNFYTTIKSNDTNFEFDLDEFYSFIQRVVLLGNPGSGKSTLAYKICNDLVNVESSRLIAGRKLTPILVTLRDYGDQKKLNNMSLIDFIESRANSFYNIKPPLGSFEYLLLNGRTIVIFDGLDELLDTSYRREISNDLEGFCNFYSSVPILVTSREVGYEQAPLDDKLFSVFRLLPFNDDQVKEYVNKWFSLDEDLSQEEQLNKAQSFMVESRSIPDLRTNPLMLALLCNIYRGLNYIPQNRPEVYENCSMMLFKRWDLSKGLHYSIYLENELTNIIQLLAYWIYEQSNLQSGVTEKRIIEKATEYLFPRRFEHREDAEEVATDFIKFCIGRAWVFTDTGLTREGEILFKFTHRSFLEYFAANYLYRTKHSVQSLMMFLLPKIAMREWDIVSQLSIQLISKNIEGAYDEIFDQLVINYKSSYGIRKINTLWFAVRCLGFLVPKPNTKRQITKYVIDYILDYGSYYKNKKAKNKLFKLNNLFEKINFYDILGDLLSVPIENLHEIIDTIIKELIFVINSPDDKVDLSIEIMLNLKTYIYSYITINEYINDELLDNIYNEIYKFCQEKILNTYNNNSGLALSAYLYNRYDLESLIKYHEIDILFEKDNNNIFGNIINDCLINDLITNIYNRSQSNIIISEKLTVDRNLEKLANILKKCKLPLFRNYKKLFNRFPMKIFEDNCFQDIKEDESCYFNPDDLFCIILILSAYLETSEQVEILLEKIMKSKNKLMKRIKIILLSGYLNIRRDLREEIEQTGLSIDQKAIIYRWVWGDFNFAENSNRKREISQKIKKELESNLNSKVL